jgi:hypothetical protein
MINIKMDFEIIYFGSQIVMETKVIISRMQFNSENRCEFKHAFSIFPYVI